jgi:hypothetical protein
VPARAGRRLRVLTSGDVDTLHIVADDLRAFPNRRNTMASQVADDLSRLASAAERGGEELRVVMARWPFDDSLGFLDYAIVVAQNRGTPEQVAQGTAARAILRRLKEAQRAPRDAVWDWESSGAGDNGDPA